MEGDSFDVGHVEGTIIESLQRSREIDCDLRIRVEGVFEGAFTDFFHGRVEADAGCLDAFKRIVTNLRNRGWDFDFAR